MKWKTIPLEPIYENAIFQEAAPGLKIGVINAVYYLSQRSKLSLPLPPYLEPAIGLCYSSYWRYKDTIREILNDIIPKILDIKRPLDYRKEKMAKGLTKKLSVKHANNRQNAQLSDRAEPHVEIFPTNSVSRESWNPGQYDHVERAKALKNNDTVKEGWLKDK